MTTWRRRGYANMALAQVGSDGETSTTSAVLGIIHSVLYCYIESLKPLLSDGFDPKAFATGAIHQQMVGEVLHKLSSGITELDKEIYSQVGIRLYGLIHQCYMVR